MINFLNRNRQNVGITSSRLLLFSIVESDKMFLMNTKRLNLEYKSTNSNINRNFQLFSTESLIGSLNLPKIPTIKWILPIIKWTFFPNRRYFDIHNSFNNVCIYSGSGGINIISLRKLLSVWSKAFNVIFNLNFFNIKVFTFGSSFFKTEINMLNWSKITPQTNLWRYVRLFFTLYNTKIDFRNYKLFFLIKRLGITTSIITDINYHSKTLFYLHKLHFYTIGVVPLNMNKNSVNLAIPLMGDNLLTNLLFIRFIFYINSESSRLKFRQNYIQH